MNKVFAEAVKGGFSLTLSKRQIKAFRFIYMLSKGVKVTDIPEAYFDMSYASVDAVMRKGLFVREDDDAMDGFKITEAGLLTMRLLEEAGYFE